MKEFICPKCKEKVEALTRDHLVPQWLLSNITYLGITRKRQKEIQACNISKICTECNLFKGGYPEYENKLVKRVMKEIAEQILKDIAESESYTQSKVDES